MTGSLSDDFGSCNYTDFVADAVGNCEKNFYISLALDQKADCRQRKTRDCLKGHLSAAKLDYFINVTLLIQRSLGSSQFYCSKTPLNISALDPKLRALIPCSDYLFAEGHNCTRRFREIFHSNRNDPSLCEAFFRARSCIQSALNRHCSNTVQVPIENQFNPFCFRHKGKPAVVQLQTPKRSTNATKTNSHRPTGVVLNRGHKPETILSRMLSLAVGVLNLKTVQGLALD
ncbi:hypothetical protein P5673_024681 [Acropora cervicornis]|uniref:Uncharacterized protein n=1 Tax=Acropora cervicornis TaxID=6130 RepID=A0AAD9Q3G9_ACRCE|nr:hypothetical protein P5673_024681 [Acropora cervicornis]